MISMHCGVDVIMDTNNSNRYNQIVYAEELDEDTINVTDTSNTDSNQTTTNENDNIIVQYDETKIEDTPLQEDIEIGNRVAVEQETSQPTKYINPDEYSELISYFNFSRKEIEIINLIRNEYQKHKNDNLDIYVVELSFVPSYENYFNVCSFFYLYYGDINNDIEENCFDFNIIGDTYAKVTLHMDKIKQYDDIRNNNMQLIQSNLCTIEDGSESEKVYRIAEHIANMISYTKGYHDVSNALRGRGVCNAYAVTFMQYCQAIGIQNDLCIGTALGDKHAWNKITYSDGTVEYYDITFFDINNGKDCSYFKMKQSPHELKSINIYY